MTGMTIPTYAELVFLKDIFDKSFLHPEPKVRAKFQATWNFYKSKYKTLCMKLEECEFNLSEIANANWAEAVSFFEKELQSDYYKFDANQRVDLTRPKAQR